uniref:Fic family protein n=1 Tax=Salinimicrobium marinum TaxID=680283 RepID=UPI003570B352
MQNHLKLSDRENFRINYLVPAIENGFVELTIADKPKSSKQKYRLTEKGRKAKQE